MKLKNVMCKLVFTTLSIMICLNPQSVKANEEITLDEILSLYKHEDTLANAVRTKTKCEIMVQDGSENPDYFIAVVDSNQIMTEISVYVPALEAIKMGKVDGDITDGYERFTLKHDGNKTMVIDHDYRIHAIYHNLPACTFLMPTKLWVKSFLSSYLGDKSSVSITRKDSSSLYEVTIREMTKIDDTLSGVLKLYLSTSDLMLKKVRFIGKSNVDKNYDGEPGIIRINLNFVETTIVSGAMNVENAEENEYLGYTKVEIK